MKPVALRCLPRRILTGAAGFRIGPFTLADLVGIDVQKLATPGGCTRGPIALPA